MELVNKGKSGYGITTLSFVNQLPEDDYCMPKHVGGVSYIIKKLFYYSHCFADVGIHIMY
jgi:hypothetical protein